jgi:hypothetical protein
MPRNLNNECFEQIEIDEIHEDAYDKAYHDEIRKQEQIDEDIENPCHLCNTETKIIHQETDKLILWCPVCGTLTTLINGNETNLITEIVTDNPNVFDY